jgi:hypothetical protein
MRDVTLHVTFARVCHAEASSYITPYHSVPLHLMSLRLHSGKTNP